MKIKDVKIGGRYVMRLTTGRFVVVMVMEEIAPARWAHGGPRRYRVRQEDSGRLFLASAAKLRYPAGGANHQFDPTSAR